MKMTATEIKTILVLHAKWRAGDPTGIKADLSYADMQGADMRDADMRYADMQGADMQGADMRYANMQGADMQGADMRYANMQGADMQGADLSYANMQGADMRDADMQGANMQGANMRDANMQDANMQDANMRYANMRYANMQGADMQGANMQGADLSRAVINWQSHDLISQILVIAAADSVDRRSIAGLILISRDWCWRNFLALTHPEKAWALATLAEHAKANAENLAALQAVIRENA